MFGFYCNMIINAQNTHNISAQKPQFRSIYGIRGDVREIDGAIKLINNEGVNFDIVELSNEGSQKLLGVLTGKSLKKKNKDDISLIKDILESAKDLVTDAKRLLEPSDIRRFSFLNGTKLINKTKENDGMVINYLKNEGFKAKGFFGLQSSSDFVDSITNIKFNDSLPLGDAIKKLAQFDPRIKIDDSRYYFNKKHFKDLQDKPLAINGLETLADSNVTSLKGYGRYSIAFETQNNQVLKFSVNPNVPKTPESFDIPVFQREIINLDAPIVFFGEKKPRLYASLQENAQNSSETWIKDSQANQILEKIEQSGYEAEDFAPSQVGVAQSRLFLLDSPCALGRELWSGD